jgi:hypothetical protein
MAPTTPLLLLDNVFDRINLYPGAVLSATSEAAGHEARRVADYRRERTDWRPTGVGEINHLDLTTNTVGASGGRWLKGAAAGFAPTGNSRLIGFLLRSTGVITTTLQTLGYWLGTSTFVVHRVGNTASRLGFYDGAFKDYGAGSAPPSDDVYHTLIFDFNAGTTKVYVDAAQVGTAGGVAYTQFALDPAANNWSLLSGTGNTQNCKGKAGTIAFYQNAAGVGGTPSVANLDLMLRGSLAWDATNLFARWEPGNALRGSVLQDVVGGHHAQLGDTANDDSVTDPIWSGGNWVISDLGANNSAAVDGIWFDRGHNLWNRNLVVEGSDDGVYWYDGQLIVFPAQGTVGGTPIIASRGAGTPLCITEEGAAYALFTAMTARRYWRVRIQYANYVPVVTGIILGSRTQLIGYSTVRDEDAGDRTEGSDVSRALYRAAERTYSRRVFPLGLEAIGASEYDSTIRALRAKLFQKNQPALVAMESGTYPERAWLMAYAGRNFTMPLNRALRRGQIPLVEVGPSLS